jgi:hypothetical protein
MPDNDKTPTPQPKPTPTPPPPPPPQRPPSRLLKEGKEPPKPRGK